MSKYLQERIREFIAYKGVTVRDFELACGLSNGSVSKMGENTRRSTVGAIARAYKELNPTWLLTGEGSMLLGAAAGSEPDTTGTCLVKYYPNVSATLGDAFLDDNPDEDYTYLRVPYSMRSQYAINVYGDSMSPEIKNGSIIFIDRWSEGFILWGHIYLICTRLGNRMVKIVKPAKDDKHVECHSINPEFATFEVERDQIFALFIVKGSVSLYTT